MTACWVFGQGCVDATYNRTGIRSQSLVKAVGEEMDNKSRGVVGCIRVGGDFGGVWCGGGSFGGGLRGE